MDIVKTSQNAARYLGEYRKWIVAQRANNPLVSPPQPLATWNFDPVTLNFIRNQMDRINKEESK